MGTYMWGWMIGYRMTDIDFNKIINKFMKKFSLIDNDKIRKHLANTSPAKITHAFPKSKRFSNPNPEYRMEHLDARKHSTIQRNPPYRRGTAALASVKGQTSPRTVSFRRDLLPTDKHHRLRSSVKPIVFRWGGRRPRIGTTPTMRWKRGLRDQEQ